MAGHSWFQKNLSLIVGVSLPVLLVLLFWLAMVIPRLTVDDPQYDLILASRYGLNGSRLNGNVDFEVHNGALFAHFSRNPYELPADQVSPSGIPAPRLYYFSSVEGSLREIRYSLPEDLAHGALAPVDVLEGRELIAENVAPDGYRFDNSYRGSRGFLFIFGGYRYNARIEKDGRTIKIPSMDQNTYAGDYSFVAWAGKGGG